MSAQNSPKKATQTQLEEAVSKQLVKLLPNILGKVLQEQLGGIVNLNRPKTKVDVLLERREYLMDEVARLDEEILQLEESGEYGQYGLQALKEQLSPRQTAYNTVSESKIASSKYAEVLAKSRESMRKMHGGIDSGIDENVTSKNINPQDAIMRNVITAGTSSGFGGAPIQEAKINQKIERVISNPHLSEQERTTLALVLGTEGIAESAPSGIPMI